MTGKISPVEAHAKSEAVWTSSEILSRSPVGVHGGRFYTEWESQAPVTREGKPMFFYQFLEGGDRWREFLADCPLDYIGNRQR